MLQGNLFPPETSWSQPTEFPELHGLVGIDYETKDSRLKTLGPGWAYCDNNVDAYVVGVSIYIEDTGFNAYYPVRHEGGGNLDESAVKRWLSHQLKGWRERKLELCITNSHYEPGWTWRWLGFEFEGPWIDVQIAEPLLDEHRRSYALDALAKDYLGEGKEYKLLKEAVRAFGLKDQGADMHRLPAPYVGPYAEPDSRLPVQIWRKQQPLLEQQGLLDAFALEQKLIRVLMDMRRRGIRVDVERALRLRDKLAFDEQCAKIELKRITGLNVDPYMAQACAAALEYEGIKSPLTANNNQPSVTQKLLEQYAASGSKVAPLILQMRRCATARTTFVEGHLLGHQIKGRIHAEFNSLRGENGGAETVRFSSSNPNMQNLPNPEKDPEIGREVRGCILPEEDEVCASLDYKSQEPRWLVNYAELTKDKDGNHLPGARMVGDRYRNDLQTDYHGVVAEMAGISRKRGKIINLAIPYGQQPWSSCEALGFEVVYEEGRNGKMWKKPGPEGAAFLENYHAAVPFVKPLIKKATTAAEQRGYITLPEGYRKRFPMVDGERWYTYKALNHLIQGASAVQTKKAMVSVYDAGHRILAPVHDELLCSVKSLAEAREIGALMCSAIALTVPVLYDLAMGPSWGEVEEVKG